MSKFKYIILLIVVFIFLNFIIYIFTEQNKNQRIELALKSHIDKLETHYEILMHQQKLTADGAFKSTILKPHVLEVFTKAYETKNKKQRDKLRVEFYNLLKHRYKRLVKKGVLQYHFVFPNNEVFLRFHKPSKYGDNLTNIRNDFAYTNEHQKVVTGFAQGRTSHAFRNVYPLFNTSKKDNTKKQHIGAMEISFSSEGLQENFTLISKMHTHFLVNKTIFDTKTWERDDLVLKYNQSAEDPNHMMTMTKKHSKERCIIQNKLKLRPILEDIKSHIIKGKQFSLYVKNNNDITSLAFFPILGNIENKTLAWIVSYENNEFIKVSLQNTLYIRVILFLVLLVLFYLIYRTLNQKEILIQLVDKKTAQLQDINENLEQKIVIEVEKSKIIEKKLFQSEKMVSMGEMIGNIAHQWRQPLSVISTASTGMQMQKEYGILADDDFIKTCQMINKNAQYLSSTIDDFRNFIKGDRKKIIFSLTDDINSFLHLVEGSIKRHNINIVLNLQDDIKINGFPNELTQCFINIFTNAKDALKENKIEKKLIIISTMMKENSVVIKIKDNAQGIPSDILPKIFEPYFTTKHQSQGTGLGLHMTYNLIVDGMGGTIEANNKSYEYDGNNYSGAEFIIVI